MGPFLVKGNDMAHEISYKLGHYKIVESPGGGLWWESHFGIGSARTGTCFVDENILIIGPSDGEKPGYLKREFMEHLGKLPHWKKTKYYCLSHALHKCNTGDRERFYEEMNQNIITSSNIRLNSLSSDKVSVTQTDHKKPYGGRNIISLKRKIMVVGNRIRSLLKP